MADQILTANKKYQFWTDSMLKDEALKFRTKFEFKKKSPKAYDAAYARGVLSEVCAHMEVVRLDWNFESIHKEALKFKTIVDFMNGSSAYQAARKRGIVEKVTSHMQKTRNEWTNASLASEAKKFSTKSEFRTKNQAAYLSACRRGEIDSICGHMTPQREKWGKERIASEAEKYKTRAEFERGSPKAYRAAIYSGLMDVVSMHMEDRAPTDNDAIYIWKAVGASFNGNSVYKVGVTSSRLGEYRVNLVSKKSGFDAEIIALHKVACRASIVESLLLKIGQNPSYNRFDGYSEFRSMTASELGSAIAITEKYRYVDSDLIALKIA